MRGKNLVMVPGPTPVPESIKAQMGRDTVAHGDAGFVKDFKEAIEDAKKLLDCSGEVFIIAGSGSLAMEMAIANNMKAGDDLLVITHGAFGDRFPDIAGRKGVNVDVLKAPWGKTVPLSEIEAHLTHKKYAAVTATHVDTSTGVEAPIAEIGKLIKEKSPETVFIVDGVAATAGAREYVDKMNIDVLFTASQKAFGVAPGLAILWASKKSLERRKSLGTIPEYYCDYEKWLPVMNNPAAYFGTPPVNMIWAFKESLRLINEEGIEKRYDRHIKQGRAMREALKAIGFTLTVDEAVAGPTLTNCRYMDGVNDADFRAAVYKEGVTLAGALGEYAGKCFRIGHMGYADDTSMITALTAIERALFKLGVPVELGKGPATYIREMAK